MRKVMRAEETFTPLLRLCFCARLRTLQCGHGIFIRYGIEIGSSLKLGQVDHTTTNQYPPIKAMRVQYPKRQDQ